ncbi:MAG: hypothetical protein ACYCYK_14160 [Candidatus Dormibacteria bacterium]
MAVSGRPTTIYDDVTERLADTGHAKGAVALWDAIQQAFRDSGPEAIRALIEKRVRELRTAANKDLKASRDVARDITPPKRRPASKSAASKRAPRAPR